MLWSWVIPVGCWVWLSLDHLGHVSKARKLRVTCLIDCIFGVDFPPSKKSDAVVGVFSCRVWNMKKHKHFGNMRLEYSPLEDVGRSHIGQMWLQCIWTAPNSSWDPVLWEGLQGPSCPAGCGICGIGDRRSSWRKWDSSMLPPSCFHEPLAGLCSGLFPHNFIF